jgi:co-chaperonin GroES (HSP10)
MRSKMNRVLGFIIYAALTIVAANAASPTSSAPWSSQANQADQQNAIQKQVGAIKSIVGTTVTITTDSAAAASVNVSPTTKIVRVEPGQTDLKNAVPLELKDLQVGDRVFVRWKASDTAQPVNAIGIIVMKRADVDAKQQHEREDWQKRSVGGLVTALDPATKTVSISVTAVGGKKSITINTTPKTVFRRYAPDSVKFDDAKVSSLDQIMPGDQLRALGTRNADGTAVDAEVVVTGSFRNIAGPILSVDPASNSITLNDLIAKKPVVVKVSDQTQLRKLPPEVAQRIAFRLKAAAGEASQSGDSSAAPGSGPPNGNRAPGNGASASSNAPQGGPGGAGRSGGGQGDLQQILNRMPASSLADFQKGDVVMVVSTEGTDSDGVTAITVVGGVDPILAASPNASQAMTLSPWSLGGSSAMDAAGNP